MFDDVINKSKKEENAWLNVLKRESAKKPRAYDELMELRNRQRIESLNGQLDNDDMVVSMIGATDYGQGNMLDQSQIEMINRNRGTIGQDGNPVDGQIRDAGYNANGDYQIDVWKKQSDGTMGVSSRVMPKKQLYGIMRHYSDSGMFAPETIDGLKKSILSENPSYTESDLDAMGKAYYQRRKMIEDQIARSRSMFGGGGGGGGGRNVANGGSGIEIAKINADQKEKERQAKKELSDREFGFRNKKFEHEVAKKAYEEAKDFLSQMSEEDRKAFVKKYPDLVKKILGIGDAAGTETPVKPAAGGAGGGVAGGFKELSRDEYQKLTDEQKKEYKKRWIEWKKGQAK